MQVEQAEKKTLVTIKEYALRNGISYQAVDQQIKRNADALDGHIMKQGKTRYLDDAAVAFLDSKRSVSPVSVINKENYEQAESMKDKMIELQDKMSGYYESLIAVQTKYTDLLEKYTALQADHSALQLLLTQKEDELKQKEEAEGAAVGTDTAPEATETAESKSIEEVQAKKENRFVRAWKEFWK